MSEAKSRKKTKGRPSNVFTIISSTPKQPGKRGRKPKRPRQYIPKPEPTYKKRVITRSEVDQLGRLNTFVEVLSKSCDPFTVDGEEQEIEEFMVRKVVESAAGQLTED